MIGYDGINARLQGLILGVLIGGLAYHCGATVAHAQAQGLGVGDEQSTIEYQLRGPMPEMSIDPGEQCLPNAFEISFPIIIQARGGWPDDVTVMQWENYINFHLLYDADGPGPDTGCCQRAIILVVPSTLPAACDDVNNFAFDSLTSEQCFAFLSPGEIAVIPRHIHSCGTGYTPLGWFGCIIGDAMMISQNYDSTTPFIDPLPSEGNYAKLLLQVARLGWNRRSRFVPYYNLDSSNTSPVEFGHGGVGPWEGLVTSNQCQAIGVGGTLTAERCDCLPACMTEDPELDGDICVDEEQSVIRTCEAGLCQGEEEEDILCLLTLDFDGDSICDDVDNCPSIPNFSQANSDGDDWGNACDLCPVTFNSSVFSTDADIWPDECDNCIFVENFSQVDTDGDGIGDECDPWILDACGDPDGNGQVQAADVFLTSTCMTGSTPCILGSMDVDGNGQIQAADAMQMANVVMGVMPRSSLQCGSAAAAGEMP